MNKNKKALVWLRRDLRLSDHKALSYATHHYDEVYLCFIFDTTILSQFTLINDRRISFIFDSLISIKQDLQQKYQSDLIIRFGNPLIEIPYLEKELSCTEVITHLDFEPQAKLRDANVSKKLARPLLANYDHVIFHPEEIRKSDNSFYKVFTPYKKKWLEKFGEEKSERIKEYRVNYHSLSKNISLISKLNSVNNLKDINRLQNNYPAQAGEQGARSTLLDFLSSDRIGRYHEKRDFPSMDEDTSRLSIHLRFGTISLRAIFRELFTKFKFTPPISKGVEIWISEIIWREFYHMILHENPKIERHTFLSQYDDMKWPGDIKHFELYKEGKTGFPIIDAAMICFKETGWMHNRLRMIVASFLCKTLLLDWRLGEEYFKQQLFDFDFSANNGGWQWSASTGCDAQPYFRIFNPWSQSLKFDPDATFIKAHISELKNEMISPKDLHSKEKSFLVYSVKPIVSYEENRKKALLLYSGHAAVSKNT